MFQEQANHRAGLSLALAIAIACLVAGLTQTVAANSDKKDVNRRSIVFDIKTPSVFYCPQEKPSDVNKMIVKSRSLDKLCEFGGKSKPKGSPSDCYNDVDESQFACDEKKRFLLRVEAEQVGTSDAEMIDDIEYVMSKGSAKKRNPNH